VVHGPASPVIASHRRGSPSIASHRDTSPSIAKHHQLSLIIASHRIASHHIASPATAGLILNFARDFDADAFDAPIDAMCCGSLEWREKDQNFVEYVKLSGLKDGGNFLSLEQYPK
jgi:hypothetical protein